MIFGKKQAKDVLISCILTLILIALIHRTWISKDNDSSTVTTPIISHEKEKLLLRNNILIANNDKILKYPVVNVSSSNTQSLSRVKLNENSAMISTSMIDKINSDHPIAKSNRFISNLSIFAEISQKFLSLVNPDFICPPSVKLNYASSLLQSSGARDTEWCTSTRDTYHVVIGLSWGGLQGNQRKEWDTRGCNDLLKLGKLQTCDERYGWTFCTDWIKNHQPIVTDRSEVKCAANLKATVYCQSKNVVIDFSKAKASGQVRVFNPGFLQTFGSRTKGKGGLPEVPGLQHIDDINDMRCDEIEERPTFVLSNDDIGNLGHYINDVMMVWNMVVIANRSPKQSILLNIDGIRAGGPAGGPPHRLMDPHDPDRHGPYADYFHSWFQQLKRGIEYGNKRVCYKEIYFQPLPGVPWFWNDWGIINQCSTQSSSPLYQSFNLFLRYYWQSMHGEASLPAPDVDRVHIVIEVRKINPAKTNNHSTARYIRNLKELIKALETIPGVRVTAQDFAKLTFQKQVALSHSAGVFLSMHGAGTTHIFHAAIGTPNCCALVELFPDDTIEFHTAHGYGNLARMLGFHTYRYVASHGRTSPQGTEVDVKKILGLTIQAVNVVKKKPTCLHDVKDTTQPIYPQSLFD